MSNPNAQAMMAAALKLMAAAQNPGGQVTNPPPNNPAPPSTEGGQANDVAALKAQLEVIELKNKIAQLEGGNNGGNQTVPNSLAPNQPNGTLTLDQIGNMTPDQVNQNWAQISALVDANPSALNAGGQPAGGNQPAATFNH